MNVLVVVAHPDDELLGCGGTILKLTRCGHRVFSCVLCRQAEARFGRPSSQRLEELTAAAYEAIGISDSLQFDFPNMKFNAVPQLDIVKAIESSIIRFKPDWVFTHHPYDVNVDHRVCADAAFAAVLLPQRQSTSLPDTMIKRMLCFEVPSSTDWSPVTAPAFRPNCFFDVQQTIESKLQALAAFDGVVRSSPHPRSITNLRALAQLRGSQVGYAAAEAFAVIRELND